jgi:hypothetical protein
MSRVIERLGLDWFVILFRKPDFEDAPLPYPDTLSEIRDKLDILWDEEKLDDALDFCSGLMKREEDRSDKVESKAFTLIGITGIATGFIIGFAGLLLDRSKIASRPVLIVAAMLYILVAISLMWTIFLAMKVVTIGAYRFTYPSANDIFELSDSSLRYVKRERAVSLFYSFAQNARVVNRKATYLGGAQLWFRNSIILLLILTLFLALHTVISTVTQVPTTTAPTPVIVPTSMGQPSSTLMPISTHTLIVTTTTTVLPSPTGTLQPLPTRPYTPTRIPTVTSTSTLLPSPTITATLTSQVNTTKAGPTIMDDNRFVRLNGRKASLKEDQGKDRERRPLRLQELTKEEITIVEGRDRHDLMSVLGLLSTQGYVTNQNLREVWGVSRSVAWQRVKEII